MRKPFDPRLLAIGVVFVILVAACSGGAGASPAPSPTGTPGDEAGEIDHPKGATELVLRFEEGGGFVAPTFAMIQVPYFSLYGDGTVLYRPASAPFLEQGPGEPLRYPPLRVARMTEAQVQALLADALGPAGLGAAKPRYENMTVADAPTAVFTVNAGGRQKQVSVYALGIGIDDHNSPSPDAEILAAMAAFAERLRDFDRETVKGAASNVGLYAPERFRAAILEGAGMGGTVPRPWPWPDFGPDAFVAGDATTGFGWPSKVLSDREAALLGLDSVAGGVSGITLLGPDGKTYELGLRPLLPDEQR